MVELKIPMRMESDIIDAISDAGYNVQYMDGQYVVIDENGSELETIDREGN